MELIQEAQAIMPFMASGPDGTLVCSENILLYLFIYPVSRGAPPPAI
jgi:hypothetical protein